MDDETEDDETLFLGYIEQMERYIADHRLDNYGDLRGADIRQHAQLLRPRLDAYIDRRIQGMLRIAWSSIADGSSQSA